MIVGETFKWLIRMNDRLDVAVWWEGPNPRPGDCHPMFPRCLSLSPPCPLSHSPLSMFLAFAHSSPSPPVFSPFHLASLSPSRFCRCYASPGYTSQLPLHWFATQEIAFRRGVAEDLLLENLLESTTEKRHMTISLNILATSLDILFAHADHSRVQTTDVHI